MGAGKTLDHVRDVDLAKYNVLSLQDVVRTTKVDIAYVKDIDVLDRCGRALIENCTWVVLPEHPYVDGKLNQRCHISNYLGHPVLSELESRGKLVAHHFQTLEQIEPTYRAFSNICISPEFFTSEAAVSLLAAMGVTAVYSIGVDGGKKYADSFEELESLRFGRPPFDHQLDRILQVCDKWNISYSSIIDPMRVFVGTQYEQSVAAKTLRYTIHKYASKPVVVQEMDALPIPEPKEPGNRQRTGFSFYRFEIPKLARFKGRALYMDADMQVFADIAELWAVPFEAQKVLCSFQQIPHAWKNNTWAQSGRQYSVMLLDCNHLQHWDMHKFVNDLDCGRFNYRDLLFDCCVVQSNEIKDKIAPSWNCLEHYEEGRTKNLHYTVVPTQPWRAWNPLEHVWLKDYRAAIEEGWLTYADVLPLVEGGLARPMLLTYFNDTERQANNSHKSLTYVRA